MEIYLTILFGIVGACIGSFLNVCIDRLPEDKSLLEPPSHCDGCQRKLSAPDLIPIFSFLFLKGRCRTCGSKIPVRVFLVELGCGLLTAFLFWDKGLTLNFAFIAFYSYVFIVIGLIDLKTQLILNKIVYPMLIAGLIIAPFFITGGDGLLGHWINALIGAGVGLGFLLIPVLVTMGRGMGVGDVKMAALIGLATGFGEVLVAILGGIILGGLMAIILLGFRIKKRKEAIPFGPFLAFATIVTMIWGTGILNWYVGLFAR
jgi:prepilin signal peptidase PulO-like enzyme (type II secretory pathway)